MMSHELPELHHRGRTGLVYEGTPIHAPPSVHEDVWGVLRRHVPAGSKVLDIGAGSGAFSRRLLEARYHVHAVDLDDEGWSVAGVEIHRQDLNAATWDLAETEYDAAVAIEVVEHLENPTGFLRNISRLLRPGGKLLITTPNVLSVESRRRIVMHGQPSFFGPGLLFSAGHQALLPYWLLEDLLLKTGYRVCERVFIGRQPVVFRKGRPWQNYLIVPWVDLLLWTIGRGIPKEAGFASNVAYVVEPGGGGS